ncbi:hypothetical protein VNO77_17277 [Canavalia gladiata]|uniref:Uncharacterized protein n=1 Tax=Canavalia gladiata TaxID=3824 RepID=A0AAN9LJE7_CANGL
MYLEQRPHVRSFEALIDEKTVVVVGICGELDVVAHCCRNGTCPTVHLRYLSDTYDSVSLSTNPFENDFSSTSTH